MTGLVDGPEDIVFCVVVTGELGFAATKPASGGRGGLSRGGRGGLGRSGLRRLPVGAVD